MPAVSPWKDRFTSLDMLALVRELRALGNARIDKAFDDAVPGGWVLTLRAPAKGRFELRFVPGRYAALLPRASEVEHAGGLEPFARELRRLLSGATIAEVPDPKGERYLEIELRRGGEDGPLLLGIELFGTGNAVIAQGGTLAAVLHPRTWRNRVVRVGAPYERPPSRADPWRIGVAELSQALLASHVDRVSTLAARLAFGGPVAEELLARAGLEGAAPATEEPFATAERLHPHIAALLAEVGEVPRGYLYTVEDASLDVEPFRALRSMPDATIEVTELPTFSEAADQYFSALRPRAETPSPEQERRGSLARLREQQLRAVADLGTEVERLRREAELLLAHYGEVEEQLRTAPESGRDPESRLVRVQIEGTEIAIDPAQSPRASAQVIFDAMKVQQLKLRGARTALMETESGLHVEPARSSVRARASTAPVRRLWFESYRWFVTSEGFLAVGGRDAASNDRIVKRYLGKNDLYFHADIHGAPSVVLKHRDGSADPSEASHRETAQWGLAFSKAWRAGLASGDAFWVTAEQVSKSGGSGEFVARGAWVIHGTKHVERDLPMELAIGTIDYEGSPRWVAAPVPSLRARGEVRALVEPGEDRDRADAEVGLARELGLSRNALQALLPSGGFRVRRA
jgi:predicted ribosome quality control (RQC) complex YloA/Tae2 family protein